MCKAGHDLCLSTGRGVSLGGFSGDEHDMAPVPVVDDELAIPVLVHVGRIRVPERVDQAAEEDIVPESQ